MILLNTPAEMKAAENKGMKFSLRMYHLTKKTSAEIENVQKVTRHPRISLSHGEADSEER